MYTVIKKGRGGREYFPTIREMVDAIHFSAGYGLKECWYDEDTHTFECLEMVPFPVRDSGGGIDCIDFDEVPSSLSFQQGYECWKAYVDFMEGYATTSPIHVTEKEYETWAEEILPF